LFALFITSGTVLPLTKTFVSSANK